MRNTCISSGRERETPWMNAHFSNVGVASSQYLRSSVEDSLVLDELSTGTPRALTRLVTHATSRPTSMLRRSLTCFSTAHHVYEDDDDEEKKDLSMDQNRIPNQARAALDILGDGTP